jgi:hypothetical protein
MERIEAVEVHFRPPAQWEPPVQRSVIECDENGLTVARLNKDGFVNKIEVRWSQVRKVSAFKRDIYAYDLICIEIESDEWIDQLNEQMEGWQSMIEALPAHLPAALPVAEWWTEVAFPAFAPNCTVLFSRE